MIGCHYSSSEMVEWLIKATEYLKDNKTHITVNAKTTYSFGANQLHLAITLGDKELIKYIISQGIDINSTDTFGNTALHIAALENNTEIFNFLLSQGANSKLKDHDCKTALEVRGDYQKLHNQDLAEDSNLDVYDYLKVMPHIDETQSSFTSTTHYINNMLHSCYSIIFNNGFDDY